MQGEVNGIKFEYDNTTEFKVQVGKDKGAYTNRKVVVGNLAQAVFLYNCINIGNGYKKRLLLSSPNLITVLAKQFS